MKKISVILRKCKSISGLGRSNSYTSLRSKSNREQDLIWEERESQITLKERDEEAVVFVGSSRRPYVISSKHLKHPLISALIDQSSFKTEEEISVKCEVVLFDHLLWMLDNADLEVDTDESALKELTELYVY
ncbi:Auxin responsive protein [Carex littledalei]|uniref:Auxin responsive protein n=1 Tax=Carex littledalei TaxID=544730 RepID=A0A833RFC0_9POAL|nr:Auxin responsive protein [Carex littledalei]